MKVGTVITFYPYTSEPKAYGIITEIHGMTTVFQSIERRLAGIKLCCNTLDLERRPDEMPHADFYSFFVEMCISRFDEYSAFVGEKL